jgi:hypothetical protein
MDLIPQLKDTSLEEALKQMGEMWSRGRKENTVFPLPDTDLPPIFH